MRKFGRQFWKAVPFIRLLISLLAGILLQQSFAYTLTSIGLFAAISFTILCVITLLTLVKKYQLRWLSGLCIQLLILCFGATCLYWQSLENNSNWIGHFANNQGAYAVTIQEPLMQKTNAYKTVAKVNWMQVNTQWKKVSGNILLYFKKDSAVTTLEYGSQLLITQKWQPIVNAGNPGSFDYKRYAGFQQFYGQVYLTKDNYRKLVGFKKKQVTTYLLSSRNYLISLLKKWVPGQKESGVAEALLIGYRNDLDQDLVQSYSNTGVVHIIAISGLHLGMIYGLLLFLLKPFQNRKWIRWVKPFLILLVLWGFSLLAGAVASIVRSAVMFSFIVIGEHFHRSTNLYNTLAASAFCMLVVNPYFFWDLGFQLSYAAVVSIVLFSKPIYQLFYFTNHIVQLFWQLNSVTIAAQLLTLPLILFYFHQFPNLFLFTNFIAVPLSGFILYAELLLLLVAGIPYINKFIGNLISFLIKEMNGVIERTDSLPFAVTNHIQLNLLQTILLFFAIGFVAWWLLQKEKKGLLIGLFFIFCISLQYAITSIHQRQQHALIVYNIPKHTAIDIIEGKKYIFIGDSTLTEKKTGQRYHLYPSRVMHGIEETDSLRNTLLLPPMIQTANKSVLILSQSLPYTAITEKIPVDIIILSGNPKIYLSQLAAVFDCQQYIFDSSNPLWKIRYWKKDAENLHLRHHTISEQGAFEVNL